MGGYYAHSLLRVTTCSGDAQGSLPSCCTVVPNRSLSLAASALRTLLTPRITSHTHHIPHPTTPHHITPPHVTSHHVTSSQVHPHLRVARSCVLLVDAAFPPSFPLAARLREFGLPSLQVVPVMGHLCEAAQTGLWHSPAFHPTARFQHRCIALVGATRALCHRLTPQVSADRCV
eukprot:GGOE01007073.1.p1 GENE.GGOE01007073.1~~GGOE01007073.1.p1  ORF type:complete len:175 (-),score=6.31 GGOE01007073.1:392-916(-)